MLAYIRTHHSHTHHSPTHSARMLSLTHTTHAPDLWTTCTATPLINRSSSPPKRRRRSRPESRDHHGGQKDDRCLRILIACRHGNDRCTTAIILKKLMSHSLAANPDRWCLLQRQWDIFLQDMGDSGQLQSFPGHDNCSVTMRIALAALTMHCMPAERGGDRQTGAPRALQGRASPL